MTGLKLTPNRPAESQINAQSQNPLATTGDQDHPVGVDFLTGTAAAFYESPFDASGDIDIHGNPLSSNDTPTGTEFGRNAVGFSGYKDLSPRVTRLTNGGDNQYSANRALVVWQTGPDTDTQIRGYLVDDRGQAQVSSNFLLADLPGNQTHPDVAGFQDGKSVVVFANSTGALAGSVSAEVLQTNGQSVAAGPFTVGTGSAPVVASLTTGNFVTAWVGTDVDGTGIHAQIFSQDGVKIGNELGTGTNPLNLITQGSQDQVAVTALDNGNFAVTWTDTSRLSGGAGQAQDSSGTAIKARLFNSSGVALTDELTVNSALSGDQYHPSITAGPNGGFVVGWTDKSQQADSTGAVDTQGSAIKAQAFDASGNKIGGELLVNAIHNGDQDNVNLSTASDGSILALFTDSSGQVSPGSNQTADTSGLGIQAASLTVDTTPVAPAGPTADTTAPTVSFNPTVQFSSRKRVTLSGTSADNVSVKGVEIYEGSKDLGAATLDASGKWTFDATLPLGYHSDISAVATDSAGNKSSKTSSHYDLQTGVTGQPYKSIEYLYTSDGSYGYSQFGANGTLLVQADSNGDATHTITGFANGQNIQSIGDDLMTGGGSKETFVFYPNFGHAEITDFIVGGGAHDKLDLSNTQFSSLTQVLNHTSMSDGSATIQVSPDNSILLDGVTKSQLKAHPGDFIFA